MSRWTSDAMFSRNIGGVGQRLNNVKYIARFDNPLMGQSLRSKEPGQLIGRSIYCFKAPGQLIIIVYCYKAAPARNRAWFGILLMYKVFCLDFCVTNQIASS